MIDVSCLCGKKFRAKPELAGRQVKCPECGQSFVVPSPTTQADDPFVVNLNEFEAQTPVDDDPLGLGQAAAQPAMPQQMGVAPQAGYGDFAQPAAPAPKSGKSKTGFYIAIGAGGLVGVGVLIGLVMLIMSLFTSPHERLMRQSIALVEDMADAIEGIDDEASAQRAVAKIEKIGKKLQALMKKAGKLKDLSPEKQKKLMEKLKPQMDKAQKRMLAASVKLRSNPQVAQKLLQAMMGIGGGLPKMPRSVPKIPGF